MQYSGNKLFSAVFGCSKTVDALSIVSCLCMVPGVKDMQIVIIVEIKLQFLLLSVISLMFSVTILIEKILCQPLNKHKKKNKKY